MFSNTKKKKNMLLNNDKSIDFTGLQGLSYKDNNVIDIDTKRRKISLTSSISNFINEKTIVGKMRGDIRYSTKYEKMKIWDLITLPIMLLITIVIWVRTVIYKLFISILSQILKFVNMLPSYGKKEDKTIEKPHIDKSMLTANKEITKMQKSIQVQEGGVQLGANLSRAIFPLSILGNACTLVIAIILIIFLIWPITFDRKLTQMVYSIFFVILSCYLIFYLLVDFFLNVEHELDVIQIVKQFIASAYLLWPVAAMVVGCAIAKAFYKMACRGDKTNILNFSKLIESNVLYILGIIVVFRLIMLARFIRKSAFLSEGFRLAYLGLEKSLSKIIKVIIIYILLRMVTLYVEDFVSDNIVFLFSKVSKNVESPPVNCNEEENNQGQQTKNGAPMEQVYKYLSMIIVLLISLFIIVVQCPHPFFPSFISLNDKIGTGIRKMLYTLTKYISQNKYDTIGEKKKGLGLVNGTPLSNLTSIVESQQSSREASSNNTSNLGKVFDSVKKFKKQEVPSIDTIQAKTTKGDNTGTEPAKIVQTKKSGFGKRALAYYDYDKLAKANAGIITNNERYGEYDKEKEPDSIDMNSIKPVINDTTILQGNGEKILNTNTSPN